MKMLTSDMLRNLILDSCLKIRPDWEFACVVNGRTQESIGCFGSNGTATASAIFYVREIQSLRQPSEVITHIATKLNHMIYLIDHPDEHEYPALA